MECMEIGEKKRLTSRSIKKELIDMGFDNLVVQKMLFLRPYMGLTYTIEKDGRIYSVLYEHTPCYVITRIQ